MDRNSIKEYLVNFQQRDFPLLIERDLSIRHSQKIVSIIGPRRAGKTYFLFQQMQSLLRQGAAKSTIIYLNFEDPRLTDIHFKDIHEIIKIHWEIYPESLSTVSVFIDEPQNIPGWEIAVRSLHDEGFPLWITGSSSKLLSKEIATSLRGRTLPYFLFPFSFKEFLKLKGKTFNVEALGSKELSFLKSLLQEYFMYGGFPEIIKENDPQIKARIIEEYFNLILYKDIIDRYSLRNTAVVKWLLRSMISAFSKELSVHKLYLTLKSQKVKASKNTLYSYMSFFEDAFFGLPLSKFSYSVRKKELSLSKFYLSDISFFRLISTTPDLGRVMENIVFLELFRRRKPLEETFYWRNVQQNEVDFVIKNGPEFQLIQVCYDFQNASEREIKSLYKAMKEFKLGSAVIITYDLEGEKSVEGMKIKLVPLWKWLLQDL